MAKSQNPKPSGAAARASEDTPQDMPIDPRLLESLVCPKSRGPLTYDKNSHELISKRAKLAYAIRDGVPIMLVDEARPL